VWSKLHGTKLGELPGHNGSVNAVVLNPKINSLVISAGDDGVIKMWNLMPEVL
jgi:WD40 repeat protein